MIGERSFESASEVSAEVISWLSDLARLLQCIERVIEQARPNDDASIEIKTLMPLLLPLIRQCRSQVPSEEMIEVWVREVQQKHGMLSPEIASETLGPDIAAPLRAAVAAAR